MKELIEKYGEEFNWYELDEEGVSFVKEAYKEICSSHPLYGIELKAAAVCGANDDVLFKCADGRYVIIHLTYSQVNSNDYPRFVVFPTKSAAMKHIEEEYLLEYGCSTCWCIELCDDINSPQKYDQFIDYIKQLIASSSYELVEASCEFENIRNDSGTWSSDIIYHKIKCKECGRTFICSVNTYRGAGSFIVEN